MKRKNLKTDILEHEWTVLCTASSVDEQTSLMSLFNLVENINASIGLDENQKKIKDEKGWYAVPFNLQLVSKLVKRDLNLDLNFDFKYQIFDPSGKQIGKEFGNNVKFAKGLDSLRLINQIGDFPITESGWYQIVLHVKTSEDGSFVKLGRTSVKINVELKEVA